MNDVQRYHADVCSIDDEGLFVKYSNYLVLQERVELLTESMEYHKGMACKWQKAAEDDLARIKELKAEVKFWQLKALDLVWITREKSDG